MFLGGDAGERLEPMRVVGRPVFDSPGFHGLSNRICGVAFQFIAFGHALFDAPIDGVRKAFPHHAIAEYIFTEKFCDIDCFTLFFHELLL